MASKRIILFGMLILISSIWLPACSKAEETASIAEESTSEAAAAPVIENTPIPPTPTAVPRNLNICIGQEPETLYMYGGSSRSMWSVLEAIYDGPFDTRSFEVQSVILEGLPAFASGDVTYQAVEVPAGGTVVDLDGELAALQSGMVILPAGCHEPGCSLQWDGSTAVQIDQMIVRFKLLPGVKWSDGTPLTAGDSVYSFEVASDSATPVSRHNIYRTQSYRALDEWTVEWVGVPGYFPLQYQTMFWTPLPKHQLEGISPAELLTAEQTSRKPLGWGPYKVDEWIPGEKITLVKNPEYFRASEGLPKFDSITYMFTGIHADNNMAAVMEGKCDLVDDTVDLVEQLEPIIEESRENRLAYYIGQGPELEQVSFGMKPASYDDGYNPYAGERADFFSDIRMRQAFASCMDRPWAVTDILIDESIVPAGFLPPDHPQFLEELSPVPFNPDEGRRLLDEVGWLDLDGDPGTPRQAYGVPNVFDGTELKVTYATTYAVQRVEVAQILVDSLRECGIGADLQQYNPGELFAPGPAGLVFGRNFDLVHFGWEVGTTPSCAFLMSGQIPAAENDWMGTNISGYSNPSLDAMCLAAGTIRPEDGDRYTSVYTDLQKLVAEDLPFLPLYFRLKMAISRPDFCGMEMDVTTRSALWNIEGFDYGEGCSQ